ncbi:hypothetical protein AB0F20_05945 [Streptomyces goshikiensis]|uniref:hypothetical protein n=1 Tax=Streptomyces goshikiensis TaxID=1942 RepID=UPI0033C7A1D9
MFTIHLVQYTALVNGSTETGIARVVTDFDTATPEECAEVIPGFITGSDLGQEPQYVLRYEKESGTIEKRLGAAGVERVGQVLMRCADRGTVWNIECFDAKGDEVTFDFAVFCS